MGSIGTLQKIGKAASLIDKKPVVINVGLDTFADDIEAAGGKVVRVDWRPPAGGDARLAALLAKLGR